MQWYKLIVIVIVHILANYTYEEKQIHVIRLVCECSDELEDEMFRSVIVLKHVVLVSFSDTKYYWNSEVVV